MANSSRALRKPPTAPDPQDTAEGNGGHQTDDQVDMQMHAAEHRLDHVAEEISGSGNDKAPDKRRERIQHHELARGNGRQPDDDRADIAHAIDEPEGKNEPGRIALQQGLAPRGNRMGCPLPHPRRPAGPAPEKKEDLVGNKRPERRRSRHAPERQKVPVRRNPTQKHHRLAFDARADQDGEKAVFGDEGFEQAGGLSGLGDRYRRRFNARGIVVFRGWWVNSLSLRNGTRFGLFGALCEDPSTALATMAECAVQWGGVYGNTRPMGRAAGVTMVSLSNTALEGCMGAVYGCEGNTHTLRRFSMHTLTLKYNQIDQRSSTACLWLRTANYSLNGILGLLSRLKNGCGL